MSHFDSLLHACCKKKCDLSNFECFEKFEKLQIYCDFHTKPFGLQRMLQKEKKSSERHFCW